MPSEQDTPDDEPKDTSDNVIQFPTKPKPLSPGSTVLLLECAADFLHEVDVDTATDADLDDLIDGCDIVTYEIQGLIDRIRDVNNTPVKHPTKPGPKPKPKPDPKPKDPPPEPKDQLEPEPLPELGSYESQVLTELMALRDRVERQEQFIEGLRVVLRVGAFAMIGATDTDDG